MPDFLLEVGTEEIPARMVEGASQELQKRVDELFRNNRLEYSGDIGVEQTPRRLTVIVSGVPAKQPDVQEQVTGPALKIAYKDGQPTAAAHSFANKVGIDVSHLNRVTTAKGEYLAAAMSIRGKTASEVLTQLLPKEIASVYWPKSMYWRAGKPERFVRPVRWLVALLDNEIIPLEFAGIRAGNQSRGHRVLGPERVLVSSPGRYIELMRTAHVIASPSERRQLINKLLDHVIKGMSGFRCRRDDGLLSTVVNLTEFPSVILGTFDKEYLSLPAEVLVTVMRDHQKYFAVEDSAGKLAPYFLAVLNTDGDPDGLICHGNERVLRARFNDARFFWQTDQKILLHDRVAMLKAVTFQKDLGSYYEKSQRVSRLAAAIAAELENSGRKLDTYALREAAQLAKTDLTTELVKEFTELQGIVGGLYAQAQGLQEKVADAIYDHYKPESMGESVPRTLEGAVLSIADKADSIAGMFALGLQPSGSKDPFALRRQANGIVRILAEHKLKLSLAKLRRAALDQYQGCAAEKQFTSSTQFSSELAAFFHERLDFYLRDIKGFRYDEVKAVLAANSDDVTDALARSEAVAQIRKSADFEAIATSFKRMKNILRQASEEGKKPAERLDTELLKDDNEKKLANAVATAANTVTALTAKQNYSAALKEIAKLRPAIDTFFDKVMVMVEDEQLRSARLALLRDILRHFSTIADFSEIVTEGKSG